MFEAFERSLEKISSLNVKAIELAFPTVIYNASCGALFSYNIESGWLYDSKCPSDCCWSTITDELTRQLKLLLKNNYCGYQTITLKKRTEMLQTSFGSLVIDADKSIFVPSSDGTIAPNPNWKDGISSKTNYYPTDVLIGRAKQYAFVWGLSKNELHSIKTRINDESVSLLSVVLSKNEGYYKLEHSPEDKNIWDSFVPDTNADKNRHLNGGLSFLVNNSLATCCGRDTSAGMIVFTPSTVSVEKDADAVSSVFVCIGNKNEIMAEGHRILNGFLLITRSYGLAVERWLLALQTKDRMALLSTHSAIGSIMSRNGSHNIGSHVLSALSHNVGTMPDDRVLYQYLQQRMDYTATVTTDFPNWIAPTRFVGNLMKTFFSQRHLLEHISESEGLGAYNFQGRNVATRQTGKIKIHLRKFGEIKNNVATAQQESRKSENSQNSEEIWKKAYRTNVPEGWGWIEFTDYTEKKPVDKIISLLKDDVTVAIPGGVVGQHAFYTIVENIIRNAAKHEWASDSRPVGIDNLDIYIDFIDRKEKAEVEFTIWNACGQLPPPTGDDNKFELCDQLNDKLHQQLITEKGDLRRENWGLAEMKISAGYLQRRSIAEIGGLNDSQDNKRTVKTPIITPVAVPDDNGKYHLGYRFAIPESKKILIVIDQGEKVPDLTAEGIYFKTSKDIEDTEKNADGNIELAYEYVVLPKFTENVEKKWLLPFRVLINQEKLDEANNLTISGKEKAAFKFFSGIDYDKLISMTDPVKIKKAVCEAWIAGLKEKCLEGDKLQETIYLQIQANAGAGGGKALVSDRDLYRLVFRECAHSVLMEASRNQNGKTAQVLTALLALTPMNLMSPLPPDDGVDSGSYIRERLVDFCDRFKRELSLSNAFMKVMRKIYHAPQTHPSDTADRGESPNSFELAFLRNVRLDLTSGSDFVKSRVKSLLRYLAETDRDKLGAALDAFCGKTDAMSPHAPVRDLGDLCDDGDETSMLRRNIELLFGTPDISGEFEKLVEKLNSAYLTSEVFLRKYEENISTLPPFYRESTTESGDAGNIDSPLDKVKRYTDDAKGADGIIARYVRHDNGKGDFYAEALSGSQSYLNALVQFNWTDSELVTRLAENALLRVLIIDERVCNFLKVRPNELAACRKMRIFAVDVDGNNTEFIPQNHRGFVEVKKPTKSEKQDESEKESKKGFGIEADNYDILIIHQGIIDKWIDAHDDKKVKPLLDAFKKVVPYVVVTTGRGRPDNIPDDARVLPFSTIESTLFRKYPEKLVLVNTVMNILPAKNVEN